MKFSGKKLLLVGFVVALLIGIPLTVYVVQQQQQTRSNAAKSTTLGFDPFSSPSAPISMQNGQNLKLNVTLNPGSNQVSFVKIEIDYDQTKFATAAGAFTNATAFPTILEGPIYTPGRIAVTLSVGADPTKVIQAPTTVGTLNLTAIGLTDSNPTPITFGSPTKVFSIASTDSGNEDVLSTTNPAAIAITQGGGPTPTGGPGGNSGPGPVCSTLTTDRSSTGAAPFSIVFTATGTSSPAAPINKATFNFGDGPVVTMTQSGGLGTSSVSVQSSHTYNNAGTYQASVLLIDSNNATSNAQTCTQTITVTTAAGTTGTSGSGSGSGSSANQASASAATATPVPPTATPVPPTAAPVQVATNQNNNSQTKGGLPINDTGPGQTFVIIGAVLGGITTVGAALFFLL